MFAILFVSLRYDSSTDAILPGMDHHVVIRTPYLDEAMNVMAYLSQSDGFDGYHMVARLDEASGEYVGFDTSPYAPDTTPSNIWGCVPF